MTQFKVRQQQDVLLSLTQIVTIRITSTMLGTFLHSQVPILMKFLLIAKLSCTPMITSMIAVPVPTLLQLIPLSLPVSALLQIPLPAQALVHTLQMISSLTHQEQTASSPSTTQNLRHSCNSRVTITSYPIFWPHLMLSQSTWLIQIFIRYSLNNHLLLLPIMHLTQSHAHPVLVSNHQPQSIWHLLRLLKALQELRPIPFLVSHNARIFLFNSLSPMKMED